jgi:hypothetical protein
MKISRSSRLLTAIVAILSLLYMQLAVAAYVCPGQPAGDRQVAVAASMSADMPDCVGMDAVQPTLCHFHANGDPAQQSVDKTSVPDVPPFVPAALVLTLLQPEFVPAVGPERYAPAALARETSPPIAIRNCCFRI